MSEANWDNNNNSTEREPVEGSGLVLLFQRRLLRVIGSAEPDAIWEAIFPGTSSSLAN